MESAENSLLVLLNKEEYYFLYDRPSVPELLESLLECKQRPESSPPGKLTIEHTRQIARCLLSRVHQEI